MPPTVIPILIIMFYRRPRYTVSCFFTRFVASPLLGILVLVPDAVERFARDNSNSNLNSRFRFRPWPESGRYSFFKR